MPSPAPPPAPPVIDVGQLRRALDLSSIGIAFTALDGRWIYVNSKLKTMCGRPFRELRHARVMELARGADQDVIAAAMNRVLVGDAPSFEHEVQLWRGDGVSFWGLLSGCVVRTDEGAPTGFLLHLRDVTRLKQAEEDLQRREKRLRLALAAGRFGEWERDARTGVTIRGGSYDEIFGLNGMGADWSIETLIEQIAPEDRARMAHLFATARERTTSTHEMYRVRRMNDGALRWISSYAEPEIEHGEVVRLFGLVVDVTEQHEAQDRLRESEERHRLAAAAISEAVWDHNLVTNRIIWTEALATGFGHAPEGLTTSGAWWLEQVHPDDLQAVQAAAAKAIDGDAPVFNAEYRFRRGDGGWAHVLDRGRIVRDASGRAVRMVGAVLDLSRRKMAEAKLMAKEAQLRTILETVPVGIVMAEFPSGEIVDGNSYVERMLGHPVLHSQDINSYDEWESYHADGTRVLGREYPLSRMVLDGEEAPEIEVNYQRGDGTRAWTRIMGRPVRDDAGNLVGGVVALVDVDSERRAKASLEALNRELETRVSQQVAARLNAEEALRQSQKLEAIGQLTGGVAHDFNNLLTVMMGSLQEITDALPAGHDLQGAAQLARSAAERGAELTSQLLSFARRQPQQPVSVAVADLLASVEALASRTLRGDITLRVEGKAQPWRLLADRAQLESALLNLCLNARDAMPQGGDLTLSARLTNLTREDLPSPEDPTPGEYCRLSVLDTGAGMGVETLRRAVEPFFTTKPQGQGTGLGLSMVYGFARQSGGVMRLASEEGRGSEISIYLPLTDQAPATLALPDPPASPAPGVARILVVEDNDLLRSQVVRQLEALGHTVIAAGNGVEALGVLRGPQAFDLLFTDMVMPGGLSGDALVEAATALRPSLKVLITTGYADYFSEADGVARKVLMKPYRRSQLAAAIADILAGR